MSLAFNKDLKKENSWFPKGIASSIINQTNIKSKSLISAFWYDGEYVFVLL